MTANSNNECLDVSRAISALECDQISQYQAWFAGSCADVVSETLEALQQPSDFPPVDAAIVSGDRIALAVDPNVPSVADVIAGSVKAFAHTEADHIDIVFWDEASDELLGEVERTVGDGIGVFRHCSSDRASLRYLGADRLADPIYLDRRLVDADFVLPIVTGRPLDTCCVHDMSGVFPWFADSRSRARHRAQLASESQPSCEAAGPIEESSWMLGVQIMVAVTASDSGAAAEVMAGTPDALRKRLTPSRRPEGGFPPSAPLVVASLDGQFAQQSWSNAARAAAAASRFTSPGGTIVLWTAIDQAPQGRLCSAGDPVLESELAQGADEQSDEEFPAWDPSIESARTLARIASEHRLLVHSRLPADTIESMGLAALESADDLTRLSRSFDECGVLRAAQYAGTTVDMPCEFANED